MIINQHRLAVEASVEVVRRVRTEDLTLRTPCASWDLGDLLAHMVAQHRGFAAASRGRGADEGVWEVRPSREDPVGAYVEAAERVLEAFAAEGVLEREFRLPEISAARTFRGSQAVAFHLLDYVVHGWDVARSIDAPYTVDEGVVATALQVAERVPDGPVRLAAGAPFAPGLPTAPEGTALDRLVASTGRSPSWPR